MAGRDVAELSADLTGQGSENGYVDVASTTGFFVGARCWLMMDDETFNDEVVITEVVSATQLGLRLAQEFDGMHLAHPNYGRDDMSDYDATATLFQPKQFIWTE